MSKETALIGLQVGLILKSIFVIFAVITFVRAIKSYKQMKKWQKVLFWLTPTFSIIGMGWIIYLSDITIHIQEIQTIPLGGLFFIILATPAATVAAASAIGLLVKE